MEESVFFPIDIRSTGQLSSVHLSSANSGFALGSGSVVLSGNVIASPTTYFSSTSKVATSNRVYKFVCSLGIGIKQCYVDPTSGQLATRGTETSGVFPANSLPIFEATVDGANRIIGLTDFRPSYI